MLEDDHRIGIFQRRPQHVAGVFERRRSHDLQAGHMGVPVFQTMGMLGGELPAGTGGHPDDHRHIELTARHVPDRGGVVDDLIERQQAEIDRHDLDDRPHAAERRTDTGADEGGFGKRRVADAVGAELVQQAPAHRVAAAIAPDILAHQKDALVLEQAPRGSRRGPPRGRWSGRHCRQFRASVRLRSGPSWQRPPVLPPYRRGGSAAPTGSQCPASAKATDLSISTAVSLSIASRSISCSMPVSRIQRAEAVDRIVLLPCLDLRLVAVKLRVEHRMSAEPVGPAFEEMQVPDRCGRKRPPAVPPLRRRRHPCRRPPRPGRCSSAL